MCFAHVLTPLRVSRCGRWPGRKALYVNSMFTYRFVGWTDEESRPLLEYLFRHMAREQYTCRFRWRSNSGVCRRVFAHMPSAVLLQVTLWM